jgi:hypothetical protein
MIEQDGTAGETAISYTNEFLDAAVKKIDKMFGKEFAKNNPALVQAYLHACALNMSSFMQAAAAMQASGLEQLLQQAIEDDER